MTQGLGFVIAFLVFSFIVFFHELGHFLLARRGGIGVEEFAIGMGPKLWSVKKGETLYSIRLLPIGGFCAMLGEDAAGSGMSGDKKDQKQDKAVPDPTRPENQPRAERLDTSPAPEIDLASHPKAFNNRPLKDRFLAILAGPMFNFILALFFAVVLILAVGSVNTRVIADADPAYPAYQAGIRNGDELLTVDGHPILEPVEASTYILVGGGNPVEVEVLRDGQKMSFRIEPQKIEVGGRTGYLIGISYQAIKPNFLTAFYYGAIKLLSMIKMTFFSLFALISGQVSLAMLSGPIGIVNALSKSYSGGLTFLQFLAVISSQIVLLSANLGVMNLLPIPALDGGRLVFLGIEAIRGKPIDPQKEGYIHFTGFVLLMLLMVVVFYSDIMKLIA